jgi:predicted pyridoxine 5'-phosphate oxidase superfamily flavin-nucleotide-binding protein
MSDSPINAQLRQAMQAGLPAAMVSCSKDGIPNTTYISQVYCVDDHHVALSFQFFSKTIRNVRENPRVAVSVIDLAVGCHWTLDLRYSHSEESGPIFDDMDMQLEAIASATGMSGVF